MQRELVTWAGPAAASWSARAYDPVARRWRRKATGFAKHQRRQAERLAVRWEEEGKLLEANLVSTVAAHAVRPLSVHIDEYVQAKRNDPKSVGAQHLDETESRLLRLAERAGWKLLGDVTQDRWTAAVAAMSEASSGRRRGEGGTLSNASRNRFRATWKGFLTWAHRDGRTERDILAKLPAWPTKGHETFRRIAFTVEQFAALWRRTLAGGERRGMDGRARAMLYLVAVRTGFRREELASLTPASFVLDADPARVRLDATRSKDGKAHEHPLQRDAAALMRAWIDEAGLPQRRPIWPAIPKYTGAMVREDLAAAGVRIEARPGQQVDFHCLRHTLSTWYAQVGIPPQAHMRLMRHSSIDLTMRYYTHLSASDLAASAERSVRSSLAPDLRADARAPDSDSEPTTAIEPRKGAVVRKPNPNGGNEMRTSDSDSEPANGDSAEKAGAGFEPANNGFAIRSESEGTDFQSVAGPALAQGGSEAPPAPCAGFARRPREGARTGARERAEAGLEPDVARAVELIGDLAAMADGGAR